MLMYRADFRHRANARMAARMRQLLVLFAAVIVGILMSVSVNYMG